VAGQRTLVGQVQMRCIRKHRYMGGMSVSELFERVVMEQVAARLRELGFSFTLEIEPAAYRFSRKRNSETEHITFVESKHHPQSLRVDFATDSNPLGVQGWRLVPGVNRWWHYEDETSLRKVVDELVNVALEKGLAWFETQAKG
jgi:hypothetical protein